MVVHHRRGHHDLHVRHDRHGHHVRRGLRGRHGHHGVVFVIIAPWFDNER